MSTAIRATGLSAAGLSVFGSFRFFAAFAVFGGRASGRRFRAPSFCVSATIPSYQKPPRAWVWRGGYRGAQALAGGGGAQPPMPGGSGDRLPVGGASPPYRGFRGVVRRRGVWGAGAHHAGEFREVRPPPGGVGGGSPP